MAKLQSPLLSLQASGSIGKELTYSTRASGAQVRFQKKQKDFESVGRKVQRDAFRSGLVLWHALPFDEKEYWDQIEKRGYADV